MRPYILAESDWKEIKKQSVDLAIPKSLKIVITSLRVAPPPNVIDPPPETPAPVTEYCEADDGDALYDNCVLPLNTFISETVKNSKGTEKLVCPDVAVY